MRFLLGFILLLFSSMLYAKPAVYLFLGGDSAQTHAALLKNPQVQGAQIVYSWKRLEPKKGVYNIKLIQQDIDFLSSIHKSLFIQVQDRSFSAKNINVPAYLLTKQYASGVVRQSNSILKGKNISGGWAAKQWNPAVQRRFQDLLRKLGEHFNGAVKGINLPETSIDFKKMPADFNGDRYFHVILQNMQVAREAFSNSDVVQYVNFFPNEWSNDHHYMSRLFQYAAKYRIGLGGPDVAPYRPGQMQNSYPFFHRYKGKLTVVAMAIQSPDYLYTDPKTGKPFTVKALYDFAVNYLGANVIFWSIQQPQFSQQALPFLKKALASE